MKKYLTNLGLNLLLAFCGIMVVVSLVALFSHSWSPINSVLLVILWCVGAWVILYFRNKKFTGHPTMTSTNIIVIVIILLCAFAGVQPMASYKDKISNKFDNIQTSPVVEANKSLVGKWTQIEDNKYSILSPSIQFLSNGTVIIDEGSSITTGTYNKLTDEYVKLSVSTDFFGFTVTSLDTIKYQISNNKLTIRVGTNVKTYQRIE